MTYNNMKYNIKWCEQKRTSTGKDKLDCTLVDEQGKETSNCTIWGDFPGFAQLVNGGNVEGDLVPAKDPKYGPTLYAPKAPKAPLGYRPKPNIAEAQEVKRKNIEAAQDRAAWMWAKYGATELATHHASFKFMGKEELLSQIEDIATKIYNMEPLTPFN